MNTERKIPTSHVRGPSSDIVSVLIGRLKESHHKVSVPYFCCAITDWLSIVTRLCHLPLGDPPLAVRVFSSPVNCSSIPYPRGRCNSLSLNWLHFILSFDTKEPNPLSSVSVTPSSPLHYLLLKVCNTWFHTYYARYLLSIFPWACGLLLFMEGITLLNSPQVGFVPSNLTINR
jgi:hypothetical protein